MGLIDHIDLRVPSLEEAGVFYRALLPVLGFTVEMPVDDWLQFCAPGEGATEFFGMTTAEDFRPNETRIAFRAGTRDEVYALRPLLERIGARVIEGPEHYEPGYHAIFWEDPFGNRLELCHREHN